MLKISQER